MIKVISGSFRDPSGQVYEVDGKIVRTVNASYLEEWRAASDSGLLAEAVAAGWLPSFHELPVPVFGARVGIEVEKIAFISYPYEWCFSQLKDAALLTLDLHLAALEKGMLLKDASAYNVQFSGVSPRFIDMLSFERHKDGAPWQAYRQFCMHFLAPLALSHYLGLWAGTFSKLRTDGIPLSHAVAMLPWKARLSPGLVLHLFAHAAMERRHVDSRKSAGRVRKVHMGKKDIANMAFSLRGLLEGLKNPAQETQWGDYYNDTNYSEAAFAFKREQVEAVAQETTNTQGMAIDLGANMGVFTALLAPYFGYVLAPDMDPLAVDLHYNKLRLEGASNVLPLVIDLSNPSPSLGWACHERDSFPVRCSASLVTALALVHHLALTEGIPFSQLAPFFADLLEDGGVLLLEFVPPEDSQVRRMTAARLDSLDWYTLESLLDGFSGFFALEKHIPIVESQRSLLVFRKK